MILCDELGDGAELAAVTQGAKGGVSFVCTVHGSSLAAPEERFGCTRALLAQNFFLRGAAGRSRRRARCGRCAGCDPAQILGAALVVLAGAAAGWQKSGAGTQARRSAAPAGTAAGPRSGRDLLPSHPAGDLLEQLKAEQAFPLLELGRCTAAPAGIARCADFGRTAGLAGLFLIPWARPRGGKRTAGGLLSKRCAELLEEAQRQAHTAEELYTKLGLCGCAVGAFAALNISAGRGNYLWISIWYSRLPPLVSLWRF